MPLLPEDYQGISKHIAIGSDFEQTTSSSVTVLGDT